MKNLILLFALFPLFLSAQDWEWAVNFDNSNVEFSKRIATDPFGNAYMTGQFNSEPLIIGGDTLTTYTSMNYFIVKYDSLGQVAWVKQPITKTVPFGLVGEFYELDTDLEGNLYVAGTYIDTIDFGSCMVTSAIAPSNTTHAFIAKLDPEGNCVWLHNGDSDKYTWADDVAIDDAGTVYVGGTFRNTITFDNLTLTSSTFPDFSASYLAKFDADGNIIWVQEIVTPGNNVYGGALDVGPDNNAYLSVYFRDSVWISGQTIYSDYRHNVLFAKIDDAGNLVWSNFAHLFVTANSASLSITDIEVNSSNEVIATGLFKGDNMELGVVLLNDQGERSNFLTKLDANGEFQWAKPIGQVENSIVVRPDVALDPLDNIYFISTFEGDFDYDSESFSSAGSSDFFIAQIQSEDAALLWGQNFGGSQGDYGNGIDFDPFGNALITGDFRGSANFDGINLTSNGSVDVFIGKIKFLDIMVNTQYPELTEFEFLVYPNPSQGNNITISAQSVDNTSITWQLFDMQGRAHSPVILLEAQSQRVQLGAIPSGVYLVKLQTSSGIYTKKLVIE